MKRPDGIADFEPKPEPFPFESRWFGSSVGPAVAQRAGATRNRHVD